MQVVALNSFVGRVGGVKYSVQRGQVLELPAGADWLTAGLVAAVEAPAAEPETPAPEKPARKRSKKE